MLIFLKLLTLYAQAAKAFKVEYAINHLGFDAGKDSKASHMSCVKVGLDVEFCDSLWSTDKIPVYGSAHRGYPRQRFAIWTCKGVK